MNTQKPSSAARSPSIFVACVIVSAAPAAAASGATVVDAFTQGRAAITSLSNADNFTTLQPSFMSAANGWTDARFGSGGSGILGRRYVATNSWGATNATASGTMAGDGQFAVSLFGGDYADNQMVAQYKFDGAIDMTQAGNSQIRITGAGSASSDPDTDGYGIGVVLFSNLRFASDVQVGWQPDPTNPEGDDLPVYGPGIGYDGRFSTQITMTGARSLGDFTFDVADFVPEAMRSSINGMQVFQYAYGGGTWNYTATSFSIVPAPGAIALLGIAGIVGTRRRR
jgi:hypothetical protein